MADAAVSAPAATAEAVAAPTSAAAVEEEPVVAAESVVPLPPHIREAQCPDAKRWIRAHSLMARARDEAVKGAVVPAALYASQAFFVCSAGVTIRGSDFDIWQQVNRYRTKREREREQIREQIKITNKRTNKNNGNNEPCRYQMHEKEE